MSYLNLLFSLLEFRFIIPISPNRHSLQLIQLCNLRVNTTQIGVLQGIVQTPSLFILVLVFSQFLLFSLEFRETFLDVREQFVNLAAFGLCIVHDFEGFLTSLFIDFCACDFLEEV